MTKNGTIHNYSIKPPKKFDYYKKMLIEELVFMPDLYDLHYGDCAVIGKIRKEATGEIYLENIRTTYFEEKQYWLKEGTFAIKLIDNLFNEYLPDGKTVELFGKVILYDKINITNNIIPTTTNDVYLKLVDYIKYELDRDLNTNIDILKEKFNEKLKKIYEPGIQIRFMNLIDSAHDLIECNLQIKNLCKDN